MWEVIFIKYSKPTEWSQSVTTCLVELKEQQGQGLNKRHCQLELLCRCFCVTIADERGKKNVVLILHRKQTLALSGVKLMWISQGHSHTVAPKIFNSETKPNSQTNRRQEKWIKNVSSIWIWILFKWNQASPELVCWSQETGANCAVSQPSLWNQNAGGVALITVATLTLLFLVELFQADSCDPELLWTFCGPELLW